MREKTKWTVVAARPWDESGHLLKLARGPDLCEAAVHVSFSRKAGHEPLESHVHVERIKVLRGSDGLRLEREVERWLLEHEDDVVAAAEEGAPDSPCSLCHTLTPAELLADVSELAPLLGLVCGECAERVACEDHDEDCPCIGCIKERARHEGARLAAESRARGGLSPLGIALLGANVEE